MKYFPFFIVKECLLLVRKQEQQVLRMQSFTLRYALKFFGVLIWKTRNEWLLWLGDWIVLVKAVSGKHRSKQSRWEKLCFLERICHCARICHINPHFAQHRFFFISCADWWWSTINKSYLCTLIVGSATRSGN